MGGRGFEEGKSSSNSGLFPSPLGGGKCKRKNHQNGSEGKQHQISVVVVGALAHLTP
ncbi:hypothetical protein ZHAS_00020072 [Anopheles sinensis]|uniref:Uncharacterized protein n=1 Tax=Anopheles sinensis TaxID=74873 RepID=A0A084WNW6_ANOSI|nr:hypothetical protein ZHAS_00020072 [Anopheles sinensis]